jgi:hypothetical protein
MRKGVVLLVEDHHCKYYLICLQEADCFTELSLTVPITNSLAFLFTVLGEWWAEGKVISRGTYIEIESGCEGSRPFTNHATDTWIGMSLVLGGIALCVHAKTS